MPYNLLTCSGFDGVNGAFTTGACMMARLSAVILFFLIAIVRKWGGEEMGFSFSFIGGLVLSIIPYLIVVTLFGSVKIALLVGIGGGLVGGYLLGPMLGGGEDY